MATSDRIRAPLRANISRMLAETDSASSTPEFVIRRNLILRKRSTSDSEATPPSLGPQLPSSPVPNEAFKADGSRKKGVHPRHQHASQRVSRDVAVAPASHPATPRNGRTSSAKTHDVGGGRGSGGTLGLTSKGDNMGEECEHVRDEPTPRELTKSSETDQQEFRYGPGFVDKLKSRFISLSLNEKSRPQSGDGKIRRYSSLENVLEQDDYLDCTNRKRPIGSLTYTGSRMPSLFVPPRNSFKRAKSMETLLLESEHNMRHKNLCNSAFTNNNNNSNRLQRPLSACDPLSGSVLINENLVIIETVQPKSADLTSKISKKKTTTRQVSVSSINDEELPKPDIVKTCKLIFETASKRPVAHSSVRKAPVLRQSAKIQKGSLTQQPNNQLSGKVVQPPINVSQPNVNLVCIAQQKFSAKDNVCVVNGDLPSQPKDVSSVTSQDKEIKAIPGEALGRIRSQGTTMTFNGCQKGKPPTSQAHLPKSVQPVKPSSPPPPPPVVKTVDKPVVSKDLPEVEVKQQPQQATQNVEPVRLVSPTTSTPNGLPASLGSESERVMKTSHRSFGTDDKKSVERSSDEVLSQDEDSDEQEEVLKPTVLLARSKPGGLWQKTPPPSNTIVYDFRGKEVKSHLPTNPAPFGCKPAKKAKKQGAGKGALVNGTAVDSTTTLVLGDFGESRDYDEDYDSDELDVGAHLPAISGITFLGENTKCGRSALLMTRNKKLNIRFVETVTTHEYPPEDPEPSWSPQEDASLTSHLTNGEVGPPNGALPPPPPDEGDEENTLPQPPPAHLLRTNMGVTSSGALSRYTPSVLSNSSESFQLGVERLTPNEQHSSPTQDNSSNSDKAQGHSSLDPSSDSAGLTSSPSSLLVEEELKPADPADMSSWSSSTSTSDLLF